MMESCKIEVGRRVSHTIAHSRFGWLSGSWTLVVGFRISQYREEPVNLLGVVEKKRQGILADSRSTTTLLLRLDLFRGCFFFLPGDVVKALKY